MDKPLIVIPVCAYDVDNCIRNLELCLKFSPNQLDYTCLIHCPRGFDFSGVRQSSEKVFKKVFTNVYDECPEEKAWPRAANWAWQNAARAVSFGYKVPWFWWEQDAVPLVANWLDKLVEAFQQVDKPFAGHIVKTDLLHYMNGVGFYPPQVSRYAQTAMRVMRQPFDIVASHVDNVVHQAGNLNHLIGHDHQRRSVSFSSRQEVEELIRSGIVIFHHNKDGSIHALLTGKKVTAVTPSVDNPSFLEQTNYQTGLFAFWPEERTVYFNPSLFVQDDTLYLFTRRYRFPNGHTKLPMTNDLAIWRLNKHLTPIDRTVPEPPNRYQREQWEDPRVINSNGTAFIGFATWVHMRGWTIRQSLCKLSSDWKRFTVHAEPKYGGNDPHPDRATRHEKNWLWFVHDSAWHCVYLSNPMTVFRLQPNGNVAKVWKSPHLALPWTLGEVRGGTTPILVGDEYVTFFHSSQHWKNGQRIYYMGAMTFGAHPPFEVRKMTVDPILAGSDKDTRVNGGPLVIFPCGAALIDKSWLVTFGVNDEACGWIKIPQDDLKKMLVPVARQQTLMEKAKALVGA